MSGVPQGFQRLDALAVKETVDRLQQRIAARFPRRNLRLVAREISAAIDDLLLTEHVSLYKVFRYGSRVAMMLLAGVLVVGVAMVFRSEGLREPESIWAWIQIAESVINDVVFAGIAMYFLWQLPDRYRRRRDLAALHRLRSLAHVIDMHQLTKDPERLRSDFERTDQSVDLGLTVIELANYLDYCSELLSLVSKTAALFAEDTTDQTVLATVEGIEDLTNGMSRKIWQKIALLPAAGRPAVPPHS